MKQVNLGPWPVGANNRLPEYSLTKDKYGRTVALRNAVNVDIDNVGNVRRREGFVKLTPGLGLTLTRTTDPFAAGWVKAPVFNGRKYRVLGSAIEYSVPFPLAGQEVDVSEFNVITFADEIRIFEPVKHGLWVVTATKTFFLAGSGPEDFVLAEVLPYGGTRGTSVHVPHSDDVIWYSARGAVVGNSGGEAKNIQEANYAAPSATAGSATIIESRGVRKYVVSLNDPTPSPLALS